MAAWLVLCVVGAPLVGALGVWLAGDRRGRTLAALAVAASGTAAIAALALLPATSSEPVVHVAVGGVVGTVSLIADGLAALMAAIASGIGAVAIVYSLAYMRGEASQARYYALLLVFVGAMNALVLSNSGTRRAVFVRTDRLSR
jgi:NADH:ubiquinone oxidoreductase subunit 5 (subunit L)/multisubunit Na+/H+ antiporter MnhA subunit